MKTMQKGFTLIELMIVVAIIGILAAVALPQYQTYVAKSQVARVVTEAGALKTVIEACVLDGQVKPVATASAVYDPTECVVGFTGSNLLGAKVTVADIGKDTTTKLGGVSVSITAEDSTATVVGAFGNNAATVLKSDRGVVWGRTEAGAWLCRTNVDAKYASNACPFVTAETVAALITAVEALLPESDE